jgi:hypothetical protein
MGKGEEIMSYVFEPVEFQQHLNNSFVNTIHALCAEGYITEDQRDEIVTHYSIIMESPKWMPKILCKWLGLKEDKVVYRLVKAVGRSKGEGNKSND